MDRAALAKFGTQFLGIFLTALLAAALAAIQNIAAAHGITCSPSINPGIAGGVGLILKSAHSGLGIASGSV